jgi:hypothetical protein
LYPLGFFGPWRKERPEMMAHAGVASHKVEQEQGRKLFPQRFLTLTVVYQSASRFGSEPLGDAIPESIDSWKIAIKY